MIFAFIYLIIKVQEGEDMIKLAVIADDLTGANDTALQFAKRNIKSSVEINFMKMEDVEDKEVIVVDTDSRDLDKELSYKKVKDICEKISKYDIKCIYKKIDSTLRGNLGAEIKAVDDVFNPDIVIIAPAYPANQRVTIGGYHLLEGKPIELTEIANAPKTPVKKSYLPSILTEQVNEKIAILDFKLLRQRTDIISKKIVEFLQEKKRWIVCDIIEEENFITLMDAVSSYKNILWVGSAGLAEYLPYFYKWKGNKELFMKKRKGSVLVCAGSVSHITQNQVRTLLNQRKINLVKINMVRLLEDKNSELIEKSQIINQLIREQKNILLATAQSDDEVEKAIEIGKKHNLSRKDVSEKIATIMAELVKSIDVNGLSGMVLTGGDMAVHICRAIGVNSIKIISEIDNGVPLGFIESNKLEKLFIVTKAGAFGKPDVFIKSIQIIVKALKKEDIYKIARPIVFGDAKIINRAIGIIGADIKCNIIDNPEKGKYQSGIIDIIDLDNLPVDLPFAKVDGRAGKAAYEYIESAVKYTMKNEIHAIVTAPLNKEALNLGGVHYPGHTEILGHLTGQKDFSMMLTSPKLRVIHVSTHIALHDVPKVVKKERISKVIDLAQETLKLMGFDEPRIAVAGLNPHCGEGGLFGDEDEKEIVPAIKEAQAKGYNVTGPVPPDSVFHRAANLDEFDIVVVMYHDQGHIPIKVLGFDSGVNVTVGLPCIRTSVDHGTAFPVAGTGKASENSMLEALRLGAQMAKVKFYDLLSK